MKKSAQTLTVFLLCLLIGALAFASSSAREGARAGIELCESVIIPALLPVLIICTLIIKSSGAGVFEVIFGALFEKLFRLPRCAASAIILGLVGGYPTGCVLTCNLFCENKIDSKTAQRIMRFNFCGGAAFIISAVGGIVYGSAKTGFVLMFSNILASFTVMLLTTVSAPKITEKAEYSKGKPFFDALPDAVEATVKALAVMSAYIVLFSALKSVVSPPDILLPILEITNGICEAESLPALHYCAFFLSFGGLCIHLQLSGFLRRMKISYLSFLTGRMMCSLLSLGYMKAYLHFFPSSLEVFSNLSQPVRSFSSGEISVSILMIIGCAVAVFDIENRKLKLI